MDAQIRKEIILWRYNCRN